MEEFHVSHGGERETRLGSNNHIRRQDEGLPVQRISDPKRRLGPLAADRKYGCNPRLPWFREGQTLQQLVCKSRSRQIDVGFKHPETGGGILVIQLRPRELIPAKAGDRQIGRLVIPVPGRKRQVGNDCSVRKRQHQCAVASPVARGGEDGKGFVGRRLFEGQCARVLPE